MVGLLRWGEDGGEDGSGKDDVGLSDAWLGSPAMGVSVWIMALYALRCRYAILNVQYDTVR